MKTLMCNVLLTRRQEMCFIQDEKGDLVWSGREIYEAIIWLMENGSNESRLVDGDEHEGLHITARRA